MEQSANVKPSGDLIHGVHPLRIHPLRVTGILAVISVSAFAIFAGNNPSSRCMVTCTVVAPTMLGGLFCLMIAGALSILPGGGLIHQSLSTRIDIPIIGGIAGGVLGTLCATGPICRMMCQLYGMSMSMTAPCVTVVPAILFAAISSFIACTYGLEDSHVGT